MSEQLTIFGASSNQNHFYSEVWGQLEFFEAKTDSWTDNCRHCLLLHSAECQEAPCAVEERADKRQGYYAIHDMPKTKNK